LVLLIDDHFVFRLKKRKKIPNNCHARFAGGNSRSSNIFLKIFKKSKRNVIKKQKKTKAIILRILHNVKRISYIIPTNLSIKVISFQKRKKDKKIRPPIIERETEIVL